MKRAALYAIISKKVSDGEVRIIDDLKTEKTKNFAGIVKNFFKNKTSILVVPGKGNKVVFRSARNLPKTKVIGVDSLNVSDFLRHRNILLEKEAAQEIK